jgi:hypothetical protein
VGGLATVNEGDVSAPFARHVEQRTIVLDDLKVLFLPVPKAGCTSILWSLADLAGLKKERFTRSTTLEVSPALTIHDIQRWPAERLLSTYEGSERERVLTEDGWLRFTVVRDPGRRLWSGWQSKLLLREPRFFETFGEEPWFPRVPENPSDLVEDFRAFAAALARGEGEDVHWSVQRSLTDQLPLNHIGRVERMQESLDRLRSHVGAISDEAATLLDAFGSLDRRENASPVPLAPHAYDEPTTTALRERFADDLATFGYAAPDTHDDQDAVAQWEERAAAALPGLRAAIDDRERLITLRDVARRREQRAQRAEARLETQAVKRVGGARSPVITNDEGHADFNVQWAWADGPLAGGFTGVVRVKDEARSLPFVLPQLLRAVERVVLVDNGSTDGTPDVAIETARAAGAEDRLEVLSYPFDISRCGPEHLGTPPASVHSLTHFYNWSFSQVRTTYALKWDGDMVLSDAGVRALADLAWQLEAAEAVVRVPRYPTYLDGDRRAFVDVQLRNNEPWGWPNRPGYSFAKAMDWELPLWGGDPRTITLPDFMCVELKYLDADEFAHWSNTDFEASERQARKRREWEVFQALNGGETPEGVVLVEAPAGRHIVDVLRDEWLPSMARRRR